MKVVPPKSNGNQTKSVVLLPLEEEDKLYDLKKSNSHYWELKTQPGVDDSPTYQIQMRILQGDESVRQKLLWRYDMLRVLVGLNALTGEVQRPIVEACMRSGPLSIFAQEMTRVGQPLYDAALAAARVTDAGAGNTNASDQVIAQGLNHHLTDDHIDAGMRLVLTQLLPRKVLARVKRDLRRNTRKPNEMKVRDYLRNLRRINNEELPCLPPFQNGQSLSDDELLDILLFGTPKSWQNEMERQGFDPMTSTLDEVVNFMENIETAEEVSKPKADDSKSSGKDKGKSKSKSTDKKDSGSTGNGKKKTPYFCKEHGPNYTHDSKDCRVLNGDAKPKGDGKFGNKTWTRKGSESTDKSKKELAALIAKSIEDGVKKATKAASAKKRKSDKKSDDSDGEEVALVEALCKNLEGFNYEAMDGLKISSDKNKDGNSDDEFDDEISV
jgi:hypothetical protein